MQKIDEMNIVKIKKWMVSNIIAKILLNGYICDDLQRNYKNLYRE